ncbi:MAG: thioredoxin family protein [Planctomycetota bacterium]
MMKRTIAYGLLILVAAVISARRYADGGCCSASPAAALTAATPSHAEAARPAIPRLVDLGRTFCIPCKKMAPILAGLKVEYAGRLDVEFIDVGDNPDAARKYGIRLIPTQVFIDASGKELSRHEGFMSRDDILGQWKKLGVEFGTGK